LHFELLNLRWSLTPAATRFMGTDKVRGGLENFMFGWLMLPFVNFWHFKNVVSKRHE